jgi:hypothetical protein
MKHWEDRFIAGEPGFWYAIIGDMCGGYFHYLKSARAWVREKTAQTFVKKKRRNDKRSH